MLWSNSAPSILQRECSLVERLLAALTDRSHHNKQPALHHPGRRSAVAALTDNCLTTRQPLALAMFDTFRMVVDAGTSKIPWDLASVCLTEDGHISGALMGGPR